MREEKIHKIEVHVVGICFDGNKLLVAKRKSSRKLFPNLWECGGGQVEAGEGFDEAVKKQLKQEFSVIIEPLEVIGTYEILASDLSKRKFQESITCRIVAL